MSSIIWKAKTFHGIGVFGRGVFTHEDEYGGRTYAGQVRDGYACGLGMTMTTRNNGDGEKDYAEYGPDGKCDGRYLGRITCSIPTTAYSFNIGADNTAASIGDPEQLVLDLGHTHYSLWERGERKATAFVSANVLCMYNGEICAPDDPRVLALIAQVAPVEVSPAAPGPHPPSPATRPQAIVRCSGSLCFRRRS
jgi:hypothetical protein